MNSISLEAIHIIADLRKINRLCIWNCINVFIKVHTSLRNSIVLGKLLFIYKVLNDVLLFRELFGGTRYFNSV